MYFFYKFILNSCSIKIVLYIKVSAFILIDESSNFIVLVSLLLELLSSLDDITIGLLIYCLWIEIKLVRYLYIYDYINIIINKFSIINNNIYLSITCFKEW